MKKIERVINIGRWKERETERERPERGSESGCFQ